MINKIAKMKVALFLLLGMGAMQSCEKDVLIGQPEWLGNSIYETLQKGIQTNDGNMRTFNYTLRLIDDLGETQTLSLSGSKTLFVCPDDIYDATYGADPQWYEKLSVAQKKEMLYGAMINNAYVLDLMSNVKGEGDPGTTAAVPQEGLALRRPTSASINDTITIYKNSDMPVNPLGDPTIDVWAAIKGEGKDIAMYRDETTKPMMHFLEPFMVKNDITNEDLQIMSNGSSSSIKDAWINGRKVISTIESGTCKNGYVYVVEGVATTSPNMAEIVNTTPEMSIWASFLKRFSCPVPMKGTILSEYRRINNTTETVYGLHYLNSSVENPCRNNGTLPYDLNDKGLLNLDPGWNQYYINGKTMYHDGATMLVPSDDVMLDWWENGAGKPMREEYGTMDNIPYETLASLMRVNMRQSLIESVPSKFQDMLDDSQGDLGARKEHILKSYMGNNGMVYLVNKVYTPAEFRSVMYPATSHSNTSFSAIYHSMTGTASGTTCTNYDFSPYLTSLDTKYTFLIPENIKTSHSADITPKVFRLIDPCSYGLDNQNLVEIYYAENNKIDAVFYTCKIDANGNVQNIGTKRSMTNDYSNKGINSKFENMLYDLLDNSIIVSDIDAGASGQKYFKTKAGSYIYVANGGAGHIFRGGFQQNYNQDISVSNNNRYAGYENGVTYAFQTDESEEIGTPMTSNKSVYQTLKEAVDDGVACSKFFSLISGDPSNDKNKLMMSENGSYQCFGHANQNQNVMVFDNYNYTVFVPEDSKIQALIDQEYLPTWTTWEYYHQLYEDNIEDPNPAVVAQAKKDSIIAVQIADRIRSFVRYHIMDNSIYIAGDPVNNTPYETAKLNTATQRFYPITVVSADASAIQIKDNLGRTRNVLSNFNNKSCRESWVTGSTDTNVSASQARISSSSYAVVHLIDDVLLYSSAEQENDNWKNVSE